MKVTLNETLQAALSEYRSAHKALLSADFDSLTRDQIMDLFKREEMASERFSRLFLSLAVSDEIEG